MREVVKAIIYKDRSYNWGQCNNRCLQMASSLTELGISKGDTVAVLAFNTPEMFEAHFFVPMTGAVLNTINTRKSWHSHFPSISFCTTCTLRSWITFITLRARQTFNTGKPLLPFMTLETSCSRWALKCLFIKLVIVKYNLMLTIQL